MVVFGCHRPLFVCQRIFCFSEYLQHHVFCVFHFLVYERYMCCCCCCCATKIFSQEHDLRKQQGPIQACSSRADWYCSIQSSLRAHLYRTALGPPARHSCETITHALCMHWLRQNLAPVRLDVAEQVQSPPKMV